MWDAIWNDETTDRWDEIEFEPIEDDEPEEEPEDETEVSLEDYLELI
jgi:hypothetical protein